MEVNRESFFQSDVRDMQSLMRTFTIAPIAESARALAMVFALLLFSTSVPATVSALNADANPEDPVKLEQFIVALAEIYSDERVHEPETVKARLRVSLSANPKNTQNYVGFYTSGAPETIRSINYSIRRMNDGQWYGSLRVSIYSARSCLRISRLKELTLLEYGRKYTFSHSKDGTRVHVVERFVAKKKQYRPREISLAAFVNEVGCVTLVTVNNM